MSDRYSPEAARRSDSIAIARVICILGVVYVHAWTGLNGLALEAARGTPQETFRWILMEVFGRSAVPLLGLISGWLVGGSSRTKDWRSHIGRKARTILLPMVLWNAIAILFVSGAAWLGTLSAPIPQSPIWIVQELFVITRNPDINVQMPFLRDLFLCMLAAPLLVRLPNVALLGVAALAGLAQIWGFGPPVLMRASILLFFALGIWARRTGLAERGAAVSPTLATLPFALLVTVQLLVTLRPNLALPAPAMATIDLSLRIVAALFFWRLAWSLAGSPARGTLLRIEPYAFFLFCAHLILIWLFGPVLGLVFGRLGTPLYPVYLVLQPLMVLAAVMGAGTLLVWITPGAAALLSGGRLKPQPPVQASSCTARA